MKRTLQRSSHLALIFIKEQMKEPTALLWTVLSPIAFYHVLISFENSILPPDSNYIESTSLFYAYISSSVALFGFALYIIGRRESGFIRSFIYSCEAKFIFLLGHFFAYSFIVIAYAVIFYIFTKPNSGTFSRMELLSIVYRCYICFLLFNTLGLLITALPLTFQNANTVLSIISFLFLILAIAGNNTQRSVEISTIYQYNPLIIAKMILAGSLHPAKQIATIIGLTFTILFYANYHYLRVNPVWSRY